MIESLAPLGEGDFCRAFLLNESLVFRFAKHEAARRSLRRENCLLPKIAGKITLRMPRPELSALAGAAEESFIAYPFLPGPALTRTEYLRLDEESRTRCAGRVAEFLSELHSIDPAVAEKCAVPKTDYAEKYSGLQKQIHENFSRQLEKNDLEFVERELADFIEPAVAETFAPVLLHGDLSPDHVLFDESEPHVTSVIDFGDLAIGDPAWDFLWIYEDYGTDFFVRALSEYGAVDKKSFARRVARFSRLEAIAWLADCLERGDPDWATAVDHLRRLKIKADDYF